MSYQANVYNVMIATPSDLSDIRQAAKDIIVKWTSIHASRHQIVLLPTGWESLAPTLEGSAQTIINKSLLSQADLLVAIFWTRIGTPTDTFPSGTVEEIERHLEAGKLALLYFSDEPIAPSKINHAQSEAVQNLKTEFRRKGITYDFTTVEDFKMKFSDHLSQTINGHESYFKGFVAEVKNVDQSLSSVFSFSNPHEPLSEAATKLVLEINKDKSGELSRSQYSGSVQTNNKNFTYKGDKKIVALWNSAVDELESSGLIKDKGYKKEFYQMTHKGYEIAEKISKNSEK